MGILEPEQSHEDWGGGGAVLMIVWGIQVEQGGGMNLKPFFDAWVRSNRIPEINLSWKSRRAGKGWTTEVALEQVHLTL